MSRLPDSICEQLDSLSEQGNRLCDAGEFASAMTLFQEAWQLLPEPKAEWEAATWLLSAIGDCQFQMQDYKAAFDSFRLIMREEMPNWNNVFVRLRRGECALEHGELEMAKSDLLFAYATQGCEIFDQEDPKYFAWLRANAAEPAGGWLSNIG